MCCHARAGKRHPSPPHSPTAPSGPGPNYRGLTMTLSYTHQSVGLLWTSDQPDAQTSTWQHTTLIRQPSRTPAGLQPTIPASVRPQTHALRPRGHWDRPDMVHPPCHRSFSILPTKHRMPTFDGPLLTATISKANDTFRTAAMTFYILQHYPCECSIYSRYLLSQTTSFQDPDASVDRSTIYINK